MVISLWNHYVINGNAEASDPLWNQYLDAAPFVDYQKIIKHAFRTNDEAPLLILINQLRSSKTKKEKYICSTLLHLYRKNQKFEEGLKFMESISSDMVSSAALKEFKKDAEAAGHTVSYATE